MRVLRAPLLACLALVACESARPSGELTREECADLVRHVQRLESADTAGLRMALTVGLRSGIDGCLEKGTQRAYRCVLSAEAPKDLETCDALLK